MMKFRRLDIRFSSKPHADFPDDRCFLYTILLPNTGPIGHNKSGTMPTRNSSAKAARCDRPAGPSLPTRLPPEARRLRGRGRLDSGVVGFPALRPAGLDEEEI